MIYVLTIGCQQFALKSDRGLATIIATLSKARRISAETHVGEFFTPPDIRLDQEPVRLGVKALPGFSISPKPTREVLEPEVLPRETRPHRPLTPLAARACAGIGAATERFLLGVGQ